MTITNMAAIPEEGSTGTPSPVRDNRYWMARGKRMRGILGTADVDYDGSLPPMY